MAADWQTMADDWWSMVDGQWMIQICITKLKENTIYVCYAYVCEYI